MQIASALPALNAFLNGLSGVLLFCGYLQIRRRRVAIHRRFMLAACATSSLFLVGYVTNHFLRHGLVTHFQGQGAIRTFYLTMLTTHTILAIVVLPLAIVTVLRGLRMQVPQHRRVARWTFPIWMYVSVTGVLVYFFLYQWFPATGR